MPPNENRIEKETALQASWRRVKEECAEFDEARILLTDDGFYVLRLDKKGIQQGTYLFSHYGELKKRESPKDVDLYNGMMSFLTKRNPKETGMVILKKGKEI